ncbi:MAG TPA: dienelactone hydrolase family protein [Bryobacteraceae bacterium]|nr:dienelactone hydrolase family protein [Bryobacteraceae bacterium]
MRDVTDFSHATPYAVVAAAVLLLAPAFAQDRLPGTAPLKDGGDFAVSMVDAIHGYLLREADRVATARERFWKRDFTSRDAYERSIAPNRASLARIIGAVDARVSANALTFDATTSAPALAGRGNGYKIYAVRWPVFEGVAAEGLLLEPDTPPVARVVALPDADWTPEALAGLEPGVPRSAQFARRLAESGCQVLVPVLIDRKSTWSGIPGIRMTNMPHREWIYRMAYETGRHIIGYEVQKVLAAVDWLVAENRKHAAPIAVAGYAEGGLIAFYSAALDTRIDATLVSGYFQPREEVWKEPIYRDVWALLREFGDAEIAAMIAPRALVIEASAVPDVKGPPPATKERSGATPNGALTTPPLENVQREIDRGRQWFAKLNAGEKLQLVASGDGRGLPGSDAALAALLRTAGAELKLAPPGEAPEDLRGTRADTSERMHRQFDELAAHTQRLIRQSPVRRSEFWRKADSSSPERWRETSQYARNYIWDEVIGRMPDPSVPANPRTRLIYDEPKFRGYEVVLDVWPGIFSYGILLVPKDLRPGERRPVVVCQHGLEGRPSDLADPAVDNPAYHRYAVRLAEQGFIAYAPQNPYIGHDRFRLIQRKAHPLKLALFSFIVGQHQRQLEWLSGLPFVDARRIGFYGLSYGGKTAMRVPPLLDGYALSICSADFNEWVWKNTSVDSRYSYLLTDEYDMIEFDLANVANYAELADLMAPRPFMVERGHADGVAPDEWVAYEFAKVRRFYATRMNMPERAEIEFFNGPHTINGKGTFEFLKRHLEWPRQSEERNE